MPRHGFHLLLTIYGARLLTHLRAQPIDWPLQIVEQTSQTMAPPKAKRLKTGGTVTTSAPLCSAAAGKTSVDALPGPVDASMRVLRRSLLQLDEADCDKIFARLLQMQLASPSKKIRLGSICTGSGAGEVGVKLIMDTLKCLVSTSASVECETVFGCEYDSAKVAWLWQNFSMQPVFANAACMGFSKAMCQISHQSIAIPDCDVLSAGFSCKDLSSLSTKRNERFSSIVKELDTCLTASEIDIIRALEDPNASSTALTLGGVLRYIEKHRPVCVVLENVKDGFSKIMDPVQQKLREFGYLSCWEAPYQPELMFTLLLGVSHVSCICRVL